MTSVDDADLLQALADADAARPVAAALTFSPERLARAAARRGRRRLVATGLAITVCVAFFAARPHAADRVDEANVAASIAADLDRLQRWFTDARDTAAVRDAAHERERRQRAAAAELRCELAFARRLPLSTEILPRSRR